LSRVFRLISVVARYLVHTGQGEICGRSGTLNSCGARGFALPFALRQCAHWVNHRFA
jgi:hypothetical protein